MATDEDEEEEEEEPEDDTEEETEETTEYEGGSTGQGALSLIVAMIPFFIFLYLGINRFLNGDWIFGLTHIFIALIAAAIGYQTVRINKEWEESVILRFGKFKRIAKSGIYFIIPFVENVIGRDMRIRALEIPTQEVISKDNISINLDTVVFMKVIDSKKSVINIQDFIYSVKQMSQTTLRDVAGGKTLDELLEKRDTYAQAVREIVDKQVERWGVDVQNINIQNIELPQDMKRALAIQAVAERESKAILIKAQAELNASKTLKQAAVAMADPNAMQLRILQSISEVSKDEANTIIMALPLETLQALGPAGVAACASINSSAARRLKWYKKKYDKEKSNDVE